MRVLVIAAVMLAPTLAHADDDTWVALADRFATDAADCHDAVGRARAASARIAASTDPAEVELHAKLVGEADALLPYCTTFSTWADGIRQLAIELQRCTDCDAVQAKLNEAADKWGGWYSVLATSKAVIDVEIADIEWAAAARERAAVIAALPGECKGGAAGACVQLGDAYAAGDGVKKSRPQARKYWKLAVKLLDRQCKRDEDADACGTLGDAYAGGHLGLKKSNKKATKYRGLATKYGNGLDAYLAE